VDPFTNRLKQILIEKAGAGIEVRLLYDPIGSQAHVNYELNAVFYSDRIAKELESDFERDLEYWSEFDRRLTRSAAP
jgi:phosphatidylserine/phosphatidylglycerophosphate/cardiolipin synthase-like enzyme